MKKVGISFIIAILTVCVALVFSLAGCGKAQGATASANGSSSGQRRTFNIENFKQQLDDSLASLVQDGTISSDQEDKIITAIANSMSSRMKSMENRTSGSSGDHSSWNGSRPSGSGSSPSWNNGSRPSGSAGGGRGFGSAMYGEALTTLVKNGTITQVQSDAVTKALEQNGGGFMQRNSSSSQNG